VNCSPLSFKEYTAKCPTVERFRRALGIASIAHFYEAADVTRWAISEVLAYLEQGSTPEFLPRLYQLGELCREINPDLANSSREAWKRMISTSSDSIAALMAAKSVHDEYLQAYAYFHILKKTTGQIADDTRLTTLDRLRLITGALNLRRYEFQDCNCYDKRYRGSCSHMYVQSQGTTDEYQWTPNVSIPLQDKYDTHTLWDLFTRSPFGIKLSDGLEASHFALQNRGAANVS